MNKKLLIINAIVFGISALFSIFLGGGWAVGALALLFSVAYVLIALILFSSNQKPKAKTYLLMAGVLLLFGFTVCSSTVFG